LGASLAENDQLAGEAMAHIFEVSHETVHYHVCVPADVIQT
jgi:hypothetical protein